MFRRLGLSAVLILFGVSLGISTANASYGAQICNKSGYKCVKIKKGDSWQKLFPSSRQRDLVRRLNRMNTRLKRGKVIAVPEDLASLDLMDIAPFPKQIRASKTNQVVVDQQKLAWGAYNRSGQLVKWGPMSGGRSYCSDVKEKCATPAGSFRVFRKEGASCESSIFPVGKGGAPMPYCTFFNGGIAFHGSSEVPGYNASHGCVRMFTEDARWLNTSFVEMGTTQVLVDNNLPRGVSAESRMNRSSSSVITGNFKKGGIPEFPWH